MRNQTDLYNLILRKTHEKNELLKEIDILTLVYESLYPNSDSLEWIKNISVKTEEDE